MLPPIETRFRERLEKDLSRMTKIGLAALLTMQVLALAAI